jgi:CMP-N-acetylneuraminic acid synthetase
MTKNYAFIFARGGSKELKNKNIKLFNGKPLIYYSIKIAKKNKNIKKIFVSSDSLAILKISKEYGAEIIKRPKKLSTDRSSEIDSWKHAVNYLTKKKDVFDNFVSIPCTSPLRISKDISQAISLIKKKNDIVVGVSKSKKYPEFNMVKKKKCTVEPLSKNLFHNRQSLSKTFDLTTIIYAASVNFIRKINYFFWEGNVKYIEIPPIRSIDIDSHDDFKLAEIIYKNQKKLKLNIR